MSVKNLKYVLESEVEKDIFSKREWEWKIHFSIKVYFLVSRSIFNLYGREKDGFGLFVEYFEISVEIQGNGKRGRERGREEREE